MSALDGFYAAWDDARQTFGQGTPTPGTDFDKSPQLTSLGSGLDAAAPGSTWSGAAATNYGKANTDHQAVFTKLAELDRRIAQQVDQSAQVVANGRQNLDQLRQWVTDAANSVPSGRQRDMMLMQIAHKGLGELTEVVQKTNAESNAVAQNIGKLGPEFDALKNEQKFGNGEKDDKGDVDALGDEEMHAVPEEERARRDVEATLSGDQDAAGRVEEILTGIKPGDPLGSLEDAYLTQMQSQQKGMSVDRLHEVEQQLGEHRKVIADSWQLMSNDDVYYSGAGDDKHGTAAALPDSVQKALNNADELFPMTQETNALKYADDLDAISQIVKDGNPEFQSGTELDRRIMFAADRAMDTLESDYPPKGVQSTVQGLFEAVDDDHQIIHDHMMSRGGADANDFLRDVNAIDWTDNGKAAGHLFSWTNEHHTGPDASIASEVAEKYGRYIGEHKSDLMSINGQTLGELNPELVKSYAHGLTRYIPDIAGLSTDDPNNGFNPIDSEHPAERPNAKGIFSVLSTQEDAFKEFHSAANAQVIAASHAWAEDIKNGVPVHPSDERLLDAQTLKALGAVGTAEAAHALGVNATQMYEQQQAAYQQALVILSSGSDLIPGYGQFLSPTIDVFGSTMESTVLGAPPSTENFTIAPLDAGESARFALNALLADGQTLVDNTDGDFSPENYFEPVDPNNPELGYKPSILDSTGLVNNGVNEPVAERVLAQILGDMLPPGTDPTIAMKNQYDDTIANPDPNPAKEPGER